MADRTNSGNFPSVIHSTVDRLMIRDQQKERRVKEKQRYEYTRTLCQLAASAVLECRHREQWTLIEDLKPNSLAANNTTDPQNLARHTLVAAAYLGKNELVTQLISDEIISHHGDTYFGRFLDCAAEAGNNEVLSRFLSESDIEAYTGNYFGPLTRAAFGGHLSTVSLLLSPAYDTGALGSSYEVAINCALQNGHMDVVIQLLEHSTFKPSKKQEIVHRALCYAARLGYPDIVSWALANGGKIDGAIRAALGESPISWAALLGHNNIVRLLLAKGANQQARRPHAPLRSAVKNGFATTAMLLIDDHIAKQGGGNYCDFFNEEILSHFWVHSLFSLAAEHGHAHILRLFVDLGFDLKRFPDTGHEALRQATENGYLSIVRMLVVEMGVDVNGKAGIVSPSSPVVIAKKLGRDDMVAFLVQLGAENPGES
ncbi:hypothetical protein P7C71_g1620, partial [Lecanoromycetidae sp. Uapishka_2]